MSLYLFIRIPAKSPAKRAEIGRITAKSHPSREYVARMESTPVVGVEIKKEAVAPLLAPSFLICVATGITPQEHRGNGIPISVAFKTARKLEGERC